MQVSEIRAESPVELVRRVFSEVLNTRDVEAIAPYWHEDIVEVFPGGVELRGREEVKQWFADIFAAFPDFHIEATHIIGEGETVFVAWRTTGTFSGAAWLGIEPTGTRVELHGVDRFTVRDAQVVHNFVEYDQLDFARQIGLMPPDHSLADRVMRAAFNAKTRARRIVARA